MEYFIQPVLHITSTFTYPDAKEWGWERKKGREIRDRQIDRIDIYIYKYQIA